MWGTDFGEGSVSRAGLEASFSQHWRYYAGADTVTLGNPRSWHRTVQGLALPRASARAVRAPQRGAGPEAAGAVSRRRSAHRADAPAPSSHRRLHLPARRAGHAGVVRHRHGAARARRDGRVARRRSGPAALSLSVFMVGFALGPLVFGPVSDHVGRRPVLLAGVAAFATFGAFGAFSRTLGAVLLWRLLMGVGAGTLLGAGRRHGARPLHRRGGARAAVVRQPRGGYRADHRAHARRRRGDARRMARDLRRARGRRHGAARDRRAAPGRVAPADAARVVRGATRARGIRARAAASRQRSATRRSSR